MTALSESGYVASEDHGERRPVTSRALRPAISTERETDADAHAEDVWHVRYDGEAHGG